MHAWSVVAFAVVAGLSLIPLAAAEPPQPGAHCDVQEEYVTEASVGRDGSTGLPVVQPGAVRPVECYY